MPAPWNTNRGNHAADNRVTMHALLRSFTVGEARRITSGYEAAQVWEAWKALCKHYEPVMAVQKHQALDHDLALAKRAAKSPEETRKLLVILEERRRQAAIMNGPCKLTGDAVQ